MKLFLYFLLSFHVLFFGVAHATNLTLLKPKNADFSPISWSFKQGENSKIIANNTKQDYNVLINLLSGEVSVTVTGNLACSNVKLSDHGLNTIICKLGSNTMLYIDNLKPGLASGTYELESAYM